MFDILQYSAFFKKHVSRRSIALIFCLISLFFLTRLVNLQTLPIFSDEGIYIRWAKVAWRDASWRFISLTDGRQPLQTWGTIPFLKMFPDDALLAGRLFSVATGFLAFAGIFVLLYYLFGKKTAFWGSFLYIFTPYFLFYDRIALVDSAVNAFFIWIFFFSILLARTMRLDIALIFGLFAGIALLAKSSIRIFLGLSVFAPILTLEKLNKKTFLRLLNFFILFFLVITLALIVYNVQRLSPYMHYIAQKNTTFVMTFDEFLKHPFAVVFSNIRIILQYVSWELGWLIVPFSILGFVKLYKKDRMLFAYLLIWLFASFFAIAFFSKVIFPRYLIFIAAMIAIPAYVFIAEILDAKWKIISLILVGMSFAYIDYAILFNPQIIFFPPVDRGQYIEGNTAGWGVKELMDFAREKSKEKPVILLAEGNFGLIGDVLDVYVKRGDAIDIRGYWPLQKKELLANQKELATHHVYAVFAQLREFPADWPLKLIKKFEKPNNSPAAIYFFELTP